MVTFGPGIAGLGGLGLARTEPGELRAAGLVTARQVEGREHAREAVSSGWPALDALLPAGGVRRGSLVEFLAGTAADAPSDVSGGGAATLACAVACRLAAAPTMGDDGRRGGTVVVVDRSGWFHPPAVLPWLEAACAGADSSGRGRLLVARPSRDDDEIWTIEQALRCAGVAAVVAWPRTAAAWTAAPGADRRPPPRHGLQQWTTALRRWQLAARAGGGVGLFVRPAAALREPSWAEARLVVAPLVGGALLERRLRLVRAGGAWGGAEAAARPAEIALDLARGWPLLAPTRHAATTGTTGVALPGGAACRAS
jgi:hypothetical protein